MYMYVPMLDQYQYHYPTEDDRAWLEEALAGQTIFTASDAIACASSCDESASKFKISRIFSRKSDNERLCWVMQDVLANVYILSNAICVHPLYRNQGIAKSLIIEDTAWQYQVNSWNLSMMIHMFAPTAYINYPSTWMPEYEWESMPPQSGALFEKMKLK